MQWLLKCDLTTSTDLSEPIFLCTRGSIYLKATRAYCNLKHHQLPASEILCSEGRHDFDLIAEELICGVLNRCLSCFIAWFSSVLDFFFPASQPELCFSCAVVCNFSTVSGRCFFTFAYFLVCNTFITSATTKTR
uniref:Uncharacterized protein LOC105126446 n=1 Tax=Rhizophora mucronata TaxID=61149 RepID=A0A2P2MBP3_RHIMU